MPWDSDLLDDQANAASHVGAHSRLLAGPGTGKTLVITRRILYLIEVLGVPADEIYSLTFTRAAAQELQQRVLRELGDEASQPRIHTLHSFALRQLLRNSHRLDHLPRPLRIADDWEERNIIQEDIKNVLGLSRINEAQALFNQLSSDWETLSAESGDFTPDAAFIGAWQEHRTIFGYTLRSELVFQLKHALEQIQDFELEAPIQHLLVDEYQDLNRCDLAVISALERQGPELFIAGDDDQSIYGFRMAHPQGIRGFLDDYPNANDLTIRTCMRSDTDILALAEFVANLDPDRIPKGTVPQGGRPPGEVALLGFADQYDEARALAELCGCLISLDGYSPSDILILSRTNTNSAFSRVLSEHFEAAGVPFSADVSSHTPLDETDGRILLSVLRLLRNRSDHLAWRTILRLRPNQIGEGSISNMLVLCRRHTIAFANLVEQIEEDPDLVDRVGRRIAQEAHDIRSLLDELEDSYDLDEMDVEEFMNLAVEIIESITDDFATRDEVSDLLLSRVQSVQSFNLSDALGMVEATNIDIEQELDPESVNMLTMHKAKGLTRDAVIVLAAEDEIIPGRQELEPFLGDERRLLFVSLSRARSKLFITFCTQRLRQQGRLGRETGTRRRTLSRFLRYAPIGPTPGMDFVSERCA